MIRIVVVEDETIERESIISILNDSIDVPIEVQGYDNGKDALNAIQEQDVDILLVDINVPYLNGLELLSKVKEMNRNIRSIILTSYNRFDYALEAIKLGVEDFLLKPIQPNDLIKAINMSVSAVKDSKQISNVSSLSNNVYIKRRFDQEFSRQVLGKMSDEVLIERSQSIGISLNSMISVMFNRTSNTGNEEAIQEFLDSNGVYFVSRDYGKITTIIFLHEQAEVDTLSYETFNNLVRGGISRVHREDFSNSLDEAVNDYIANNISSYPFAPTTNLNTLIDNLLTYKDTVTQENLYDLTEVIAFMIYHYDDVALSVFLQNLHNDLYKKIQDLYPNLVLAFTTKIKHYFNVNTRFAEIHANLFQIIKLNLDALGESGNSVDNRHNLKALKYIEDNFKKNISLNDIADFLQVTPQYVSKIISEHSDSSFIEILNNYRIKEAIRLLDTNMSIKEIGYEIGYKSSTYFGRVFKKHVGVTPSQYREQLVISSQK